LSTLLPDTANYDPIRYSQMEQGFTLPCDRNSPTGLQDMPTQQDFSPGRFSPTPVSGRPVLQGLLSANPEQQMVGAFFFRLTLVGRAA